VSQIFGGLHSGERSDRTEQLIETIPPQDCGIPHPAANLSRGISKVAAEDRFLLGPKQNQLWVLQVAGSYPAAPTSF
jgi:hypothetical protein